jgi:cobyric acid synthase
LRNVAGTLHLPGSPAFSGYEIHMGSTSGPALARPADIERLADATEAALDWSVLDEWLGCTSKEQ